MREERIVLGLCDHVRDTLCVDTYLRHGHLERIYENGLAHRLRKSGLSVVQENCFEVLDEDGTSLGHYVVDLLIEHCLIVEVKACRALAPEHVAQVLGQLDALLINFGAQNSRSESSSSNQ